MRGARWGRQLRLGLAVACGLSLLTAPLNGQEPEERRDELFRLHSTFLGPVGGIRIVDAAAAPKNTFRIALASEFFFLRDFIVEGDETRHVSGTLALSYAAHEHLEVFGAFYLSSTSNTAGTPELLQTLGDIYLGLKGFHWVLPWLAVGGDGTVAFLNSVGSARPAADGISGGLRANVSADMRHLPKKRVPLIARFNLQYWFDNSANLVDDTESARYGALPDPLPLPLETRHLISAVERFGLGINRTDFVNIGLGFEAPLRAGKVFLHPLLEWAWGIPVNRQGFSCTSVPAPGQDGCLTDEGVSAFPMTLTMALRIFPPARGLSVLVGTEVGLTGTRDFVRELAPTAPYRIWLGVAYAVDPTPPKPAAPEPAPPAFVRLDGAVLEQGEGAAPIGGAVVRVADSTLSAVVTDAQGGFEIVVPVADEIALEVSHADYVSGRCSTTLDPEEAATVECRLERDVREGTLEARLADSTGAAAAGVPVTISGPAEHSVESSADGSLRLEGLPPGSYSALVATPEYFVKMTEFEVVAGQTTRLGVGLVRRPKNPQVRVTKRRILLRSQISFATGSDEILPNSEPLLLEVADTLSRSSAIQLVEVQGHTDNRGSRATNRALSQKRAESVRRWLIAHGIDDSRLAARGYGPDRPLAPNITVRNRARNRRVQFVIRKRAE